MFKVQYLVKTDSGINVRTIEVSVGINEIQSFIETIRSGGGQIRQTWEDVTKWASKRSGEYYYNWITYLKNDIA